MFDDVIGMLDSSKNIFEANIKDSFGNSILETVYEPSLLEERTLNGAYNEAILKMREIDMITMELRMII